MNPLKSLAVTWMPNIWFLRLQTPCKVCDHPRWRLDFGVETRVLIVLPASEISWWLRGIPHCPSLKNFFHRYSRYTRYVKKRWFEFIIINVVHLECKPQVPCFQYQHVTIGKLRTGRFLTHEHHILNYFLFHGITESTFSHFAPLTTHRCCHNHGPPFLGNAW